MDSQTIVPYRSGSPISYTPSANQLFVILPFLPPTSNHIYGTGRGGKRFLTREADTFKKNAISQISQDCQAMISQINPKGVYRTWYAFYFHDDEVLNKSFGTGVKKAAPSRYKRMDVENRIKLVADALAIAIGVDDSQFFESGHTKMLCSLVGGSPQLHIYLTEVEPTRFGL